MLNLANNYVLKGRVSRYGTINVLASGVPEPRLSLWAGLVLFSDKLIGKSNLKAQSTDTGKLQLLDEGRVVSVLEPKDLYVVEPAHSGRYEVMGGGWLTEARSHRHFRTSSKSEFLHCRRMPAILRRVEKGIKPPYYDGSFFVKVNPALRRKVVILLGLRHPTFSSRFEFRAIDSKGRNVPCEVHFPLSEKKWLR